MRNLVITQDLVDMVNNGVKSSSDNWGTGLIVQDPVTGKILLAKRTDTGTYGGPGGKVETGEAPKDGVLRECMEESNVIVNSMSFYGINLHDSPNRKNWVDFLFYTNDFDASLLQNQESEMEPFDWYDVDVALQMDLFPPTRQGLEIAIENGLLTLNSNPSNVIPFVECPTSASQIMDSPHCQYSYEEPEHIFTTHQWLYWD